MCAAAQQPPTIAVAPQASSASTGTVTGRIVCSDTQRPARFADVMLVAVPSGTDSRGRFGGSGGGARTDLDGIFTATNVAVGDYYATANATGYISQNSVVQAGLSPNASPDALAALAALPVVHVSAGTSSTVNLTLERGAVIAGKMTWDDGSPAGGVQVSVVAQTAQTTGPQQGITLGGLGGFQGGGFGGGGFGSMTDDRGQFRLTGLAAGVYLLRATVTAPVATNAPATSPRNVGVTMYAPGKVRKSDATVITLGAGEERDDVQFQLDLRALHKVSGHVEAVSGSTIGSGNVRVTDSQDSSLTRTGPIGADGSYVLNYVPDGTYTLTVPNAGPAPAPGARGNPGGGGRGQGGSNTASVSYQPFQETLTVSGGDVTGVNVELAPAASK
jgi:Carboxypeptidase regulatory-like domain